jgi:small subunit ribosomal protein S14
MAKTSNLVMQRRLRARRAAGKLKFSTRYYNRCRRCGRARGYYRKFDICRICLRELALEGKIPGMTKSSW